MTNSVIGTSPPIAEFISFAAMMKIVANKNNAATKPVINGALSKQRVRPKNSGTIPIAIYADKYAECIVMGMKLTDTHIAIIMDISGLMTAIRIITNCMTIDELMAATRVP
jgi:hypothetical protein